MSTMTILLATVVAPLLLMGLQVGGMFIGQVGAPSVDCRDIHANCAGFPAIHEETKDFYCQRHWPQDNCKQFCGLCEPGQVQPPQGQPHQGQPPQVQPDQGQPDTGDHDTVAGSRIVLTANPTSVRPLATKKLDLECSMNGEKDFDFMTSIVVARGDVDVAMVTSYSPATALGNSTAVVTGEIKGKDGRLHIHWVYPGDEQTGEYECHVTGSRTKQRPQTLKKQIEVVKHQGEQSSAQDLVKQMLKKTQELETQNYKHQQEINQLKTQTSQLKADNSLMHSTITKLAQRIDDVNATSLHVETGQLSCDLGLETGSRDRYADCEVTFAEPYDKPPAVIVSPVRMDSQKITEDASYDVRVKKITSTGFEVQTVAFDGSHIEGLVVRWMSVAKA